MERIGITIRGLHGSATVLFQLAQWRGMAPISRVLALHEAARDVTGGKPFDVIGETIRNA